jgi:bifunctional non-homologous end joining protein LigD
VAVSFPVDPMKATLGTLPHDDEGWAYEIKWDGYRTIAFVDRRAGRGTTAAGRAVPRLRLQSSRGLDVTIKYPEMSGLAEAVGAERAVLDGELVVLDDDGAPRFELIQRHESQVAFYVFDVLHVDGHDTIGLVYERRRELLADLLEAGTNWAVPGHRIGGGEELLAATRERQLEGVMAKRLGTTYLPGKRSPNWRKVKNRIRTEVTIGGFSSGTGNRESTFGSLLVGVPVEEGSRTLRFAGGVGTGFDQRMLQALTKKMRSLTTDRCPFDPRPPRIVTRDATWVEPELRAEIEMTEWTNDGFVRQASFMRLV